MGVCFGCECLLKGCVVGRSQSAVPAIMRSLHAIYLQHHTHYSAARFARGFSRVRWLSFHLHVVKCETADGQDGVVSVLSEFF